MNFHRLLAVAALALSAAAWSQTQDQPQAGQQRPDAQTHTASPQADPGRRLQQQLQDMQSDWEKLSQATDPAERQKILQAHREKMLQLAALLRAQADNQAGQAADCPMMMDHGDDMAGPADCPMMKSGGCAMMMGQGNPLDRHQELLAAFHQLEKRVDLLQSTVQRLLDAQNR